MAPHTHPSLVALAWPAPPPAAVLRTAKKSTLGSSRAPTRAGNTANPPRTLATAAARAARTHGRRSTSAQPVRSKPTVGGATNAAEQAPARGRTGSSGRAVRRRRPDRERCRTPRRRRPVKGVSRSIPTTASPAYTMSASTVTPRATAVAAAPPSAAPSTPSSVVAPGSPPPPSPSSSPPPPRWAAQRSLTAGRGGRQQRQGLVGVPLPRPWEGGGDGRRRPPVSAAAGSGGAARRQRRATGPPNGATRRGVKRPRRRQRRRQLPQGRRQK